LTSKATVDEEHAPTLGEAHGGRPDLVSVARLGTAPGEILARVEATATLAGVQTGRLPSANDLEASHPVKVRIETIRSEPWHHATKALLEGLAAEDEVGAHRIVASAEEADLIIFADLHQHGGDPHLRHLRRHPAVRTYPERVRVIDIRDRPFFTFPGIYVSWPGGSRGSDGAVGGCYPELPTTVWPAAVQPRLLYSFQGGRTHPVRDSLFALEPRPDTVVEDTSDLNFFDVAESDAARQSAQSRYRETVLDSRFVLCPRGHGRSSFRIFETLSAGRVPVIISDGWCPPPGVDWGTCSLRVAESDAPFISAIVEDAIDDWPDLAAGAQQVWSSHFAPSRRWHTFIEALSRVDRRLPVPLMQREHLRLLVLGTAHRLARVGR
jgi:hypothetical protein